MGKWEPVEGVGAFYNRRCNLPVVESQTRILRLRINQLIRMLQYLVKARWVVVIDAQYLRNAQGKQLLVLQIAKEPE